MATNTAPTASSNPTPAPALWHAPIFVVGVVAIVGVWFCRPLLRGDCHNRHERDLASARQILSRADGDASYALELIQRALDAANLPADQLAQAAFLAGSAHVRLAEKADRVQAKASWLEAREMLQQAQTADLGEEDAHLLRYRLGKAGFYIGDDPARAIADLEATIDFAEDRAEGYRLIQEAYLKTNPPNLAKAIEANRKLRDIGGVSLAELNEAKLAGGEILLRMGQFAEARQSLEKIPDQAPPGTLLKARLLMARSFQEEKQWNEASRLYVLVLSETRVPLPEPALVHYNRGICYRQLNQVSDAARAWRLCLKEANGPEVQAAALSLAELTLAEPSAHESAVDMLKLALARVESPAAWTNPLIDLVKARDIFERSIQTLRQVTRYDLTSRAIELYARIAPPRRIIVLQAETKAEWGKAMLESAKGKPTDEQAEQAKKLLAQSAEAFGKLADEANVSPADRSTYLWACAQSAILARDDKQSRLRLEDFVNLGAEPAKMGEAWYQLGELYRKAKNKEQAGIAYRKCQQFDDIHATCRANYQLAMAAVEANEPEEAETALIINLKMLRFDNDHDALRQTIFTLGNLFYQRKRYAQLVRWLEDALGKFEASPEVFLARFQLADSYRQLGLLASQSNLISEGMTAASQQFFLSQRNMWRQKAADEFAALEALLDTAQGKEMLTPRLRRDVPLIAAKCLCDAGKWEKSLLIYQKIVERNPGKLEAIDALAGAMSCHVGLEQLDHVRACLIQIQKTLPEIPDLPAQSRQAWERWIEEAKKGIKDIPEGKQ